jgi:hypothetical protein
MQVKRRFGLLVVGVFAAIAGVGEIVVGGHRKLSYLGSFASDRAFDRHGDDWAFDSLGGLFILTMRKWGAAIGVSFIGAEVLGRIYLVLTGGAVEWTRRGEDCNWRGHRTCSDRLCVVEMAFSSLGTQSPGSW